MITEGKDNPVSLARIDHRMGVSEIRRDWLFQQYVFSSLGGRDGLRTMQFVGCRD